MRRYRRAREKTRSALHRLAVGDGDVRSRLKRAYWVLRQLSEHDLPVDLHEPFRSILRDLTKYGPEISPDGEVYRRAVDHTMSKIKNSTGRKIAERIYTFSRAVEML